MIRNMNAPVIEVNFLDLQKANENSLFKSKCPVCEDGLLLIYRDQKTGELQEYDRCIACGQSVKYLDIKKLRQFEKGGTYLDEIKERKLA